jgi:hypothetical protein
MRNKAGTEERYRRLLAEQARSGLSVRAFARTSGVPAGTLSSWKHELKKREAARATKGKTADLFVPVEVIDQAEPPSGGAGYEVVLGRALVLRLPRDFDVHRVAALVKAVASC